MSRRDRKKIQECELATVCPYCGKRNDVCTRPGGPGRGPEPGDIMLCAQCGELAVFADGGTLRKPTEAETFAWSMDPAFAPVARARVLARLRADTGGLPVAVVGVSFGADGSVSVTGPLPPEVLDDYIRPRERREE